MNQITIIDQRQAQAVEAIRRGAREMPRCSHADEWKLVRDMPALDLCQDLARDRPLVREAKNADALAAAFTARLMSLFPPRNVATGEGFAAAIASCWADCEPVVAGMVLDRAPRKIEWLSAKALADVIAECREEYLDVKRRAIGALREHERRALPKPCQADPNQRPAAEDIAAVEAMSADQRGELLARINAARAEAGQPELGDVAAGLPGFLAAAAMRCWVKIDDKAENLAV